MARKTIPFTELINAANYVLRTSPAAHRDRRQGIIDFTASVLSQFGAYNGFKYLLDNELLDGVGGINYVNGMPHENIVQRFANTDSTRIRFLRG